MEAVILMVVVPVVVGGLVSFVLCVLEDAIFGDE